MIRAIKNVMTYGVILTVLFHPRIALKDKFVQGLDTMSVSMEQLTGAKYPRIQESATFNTVADALNDAYENRIVGGLVGRKGGSDLLPATSISNADGSPAINYITIPDHSQVASR